MKNAEYHIERIDSEGKKVYLQREIFSIPDTFSEDFEGRRKFTLSELAIANKIVSDLAKSGIRSYVHDMSQY